MLPTPSAGEKEKEAELQLSSDMRPAAAITSGEGASTNAATKAKPHAYSRELSSLSAATMQADGSVPRVRRAPPQVRTPPGRDATVGNNCVFTRCTTFF
jgi:hypothetical protein